MKLKLKALVLLLTFILLSGCNKIKLSNAELINLTPANINMNNITYILTDEILGMDGVGEQIGEITKVNKLVSYLEEDEPYKNPNRIFKVIDLKIEDAIAVEVNDKLYKAEIKK